MQLPVNRGIRSYDQQVEDALLHMEYYGGHACHLAYQDPVINGVFIKDQPVLKALVAFFESEGWELSGTGYFSAVFTQGDLALKVGLKREDSGATYAAWCRANQNLPGVPKIHRIEKFANCYVVLTSRCYPIDGQLLTPTVLFERKHLRDVIKGRVAPDGTSPIAVTVALIRDFFDGVAEFDLNNGNIMVDGAGEYVITDPVSYDYPRNYDGSSYNYDDYYTEYRPDYTWGGSGRKTRNIDTRRVTRDTV